MVTNGCQSLKSYIKVVHTHFIYFSHDAVRENSTNPSSARNTANDATDQHDLKMIKRIYLQL